jgi:hypothetical protein
VRPQWFVGVLRVWKNRFYFGLTYTYSFGIRIYISPWEC